NLEKVDDGFEVNNISTNKAYKVTYQTKVKDRVLEEDGLNVKNAAGFGSESDSSGTHVGQFYGSKSAGEVDYAEKTIEWTIRVNHDEYPMENISIEDTLSDGLTLLKDSVAITVDGDPYDDYNLSGDIHSLLTSQKIKQPIKKLLLRTKKNLMPMKLKKLNKKVK